MTNLADIAFDKKLDLLNWANTTQANVYLASQSKAQQLPEDTMERALRQLDIATTYSISSEICQVLQGAAKKLMDNPEVMEGFLFEASDLPEPQGFVYFEKPIVFLDGKGKSMVVSSMQWYGVWAVDPAGPEERGVGITLFTDIRDPRDHLYPDFMMDKFLKPKHSLVIVPAALPAFGGMGSFGTVPESDAGVFLLSFLRFIKEPWLSTSSTRLSRQAMRRGMRADVPICDTLVVRLRKRAPSEAAGDHAPTHVEWTHQWIVGAGTGGFWRKQWYPSENRHKPKFIHPYVKGPADKPLVVKDVAFVVNR